MMTKTTDHHVALVCISTVSSQALPSMEKKGRKQEEALFPKMKEPLRTSPPETGHPFKKDAFPRI
jgi:hypothetical protein